MGDSLKTAEDEMNFILGNDDDYDDSEQLFGTLHAVDSVASLAALSPACAYDGDNEEGSPLSSFAATETGSSSLSSAASQFYSILDDVGKSCRVLNQNALMSRKVSLSPAAFDSLPYGVDAYNAVAAMGTTTATASAFATSKYFDQPLGGPLMMADPLPKLMPHELDAFKMDLDFDLADLGPAQGEQRHFMMDTMYGSAAVASSETAVVAPKKKRKGIVTTRSSRYLPPLVHQANLPPEEPKRPLRKRKVELSQLHSTFDVSNEGIAIDPGMTPEKAAEARNARKLRRISRAKGQAINLVGNGDIAEIERQAVSDSDCPSLRVPSLVVDFGREFSPEKFVDTAWEHVYPTLIETSLANDVDDAAASDYSMEAFPMQVTSDLTIIPPALSPTNIMPDLTASTPVTPPPPATAKEDTLKSLPTGKDPESRRLRRLMRNRLSAQASRDRRRKAIEDATKQKEARMEEIVFLERRVDEETQRMMLLEKAVNFARDYLGRDQYARITKNVNLVPRD